MGLMRSPASSRLCCRGLRSAVWRLGGWAAGQVAIPCPEGLATIELVDADDHDGPLTGRCVPLGNNCAWNCTRNVQFHAQSFPVPSQ